MFIATHDLEVNQTIRTITSGESAVFYLGPLDIRERVYRYSLAESQLEAFLHGIQILSGVGIQFDDDSSCFSLSSKGNAYPIRGKVLISLPAPVVTDTICCCGSSSNKASSLLKAFDLFHSLFCLTIHFSSSC